MNSQFFQKKREKFKKNIENCFAYKKKLLLLQCQNKTTTLDPSMSGLVSGLQNRVQQFESARNLKKTSQCEVFFVFNNNNQTTWRIYLQTQ